MFPYSEIASKILLGRSKLGYVVNYSLAPYFRVKPFNSLKPECVSVTPKLLPALMSLLTELVTESN